MRVERPRQTKGVAKLSSRSQGRSRGSSKDAEPFKIVAIGASAGGLDAVRGLLKALPSGGGMAFILVLHLEPNHESMMVELLAGHTPLIVCQATEGMVVERDRLYVIPPGVYLSTSNGGLRLSRPPVRDGQRLPFDFLLHSLARDYGSRVICLILSGTGADGSLGLKSVKDGRGLIFAQDPSEAAYDGMPRNAIATGVVDLVLKVADMPNALRDPPKPSKNPSTISVRAASGALDHLNEIIDLLHTRTSQDFALYKRGTVLRRIERRMSMASLKPGDLDRYLSTLRRDPDELDRLAKDLNINVSSFFRDPDVFDLLSSTIAPQLVRDQPADMPIRIWIAGCSAGQEAYSLAIVFHEAIAGTRPETKLQVFASDVDPDAVAQAREGLFPESVAAEMSATRLSRFFSREDRGYRVAPELRALVIFTVQDVLADPPFSRLDLISCRNLLIYLGPEAQSKVVSRFHFGLRDGGVLLLGSAETIGNTTRLFEEVSKPARLYKRIGKRRPPEALPLTESVYEVPGLLRKVQTPGPPRKSSFATLCQRMALESLAPAAVLVNRKLESLHVMGPVDRFLRVANGDSTLDLLAMARPGVRTKLRSAIQQAWASTSRVLERGGRTIHDGAEVWFTIDVQPVLSEGAELMFICFIEDQKRTEKRLASKDVSRVTYLEHELQAARTELETAVRNHSTFGEEQKAINDEALSVNEEYQSTNEELISSKEELQSLNEELSALNGQLQETLEKQRTTSSDLQNVLYSTDVATLFLDVHLKIRFFTPAVKSLFNVIPTDVGRPLADLSSLAADGTLLSDAGMVLCDGLSKEREIEAHGAIWFIRRILPYRGPDDRVEGVVITFTDITDRKLAAKALEAAKLHAERANAAKSRFLAAASHDLRQPLQTLVLLQSLLIKAVEGKRALGLVARCEETLGAMSGMLNTLLDINQIEAGTVRADVFDFPISDLLDQLRDEFSYYAQSQNLDLRVVPCGLSIRTDPRLLEQMIRNLLTNAMKYTRRGKVLLGCRRRGTVLSIEVWDTGIGIADGELQAIFEEYHQVGNAERDRSHGLGLGLSIVQRLGNLLGHAVRVRSHPGRGSVFCVDVLVSEGASAPRRIEGGHRETDPAASERQTGTVLIIEDDPAVRELLEILLKDEGHGTATCNDGAVAIEMVTRRAVRPDLILADYNLPGDMDGLRVAATLRERMRRKIPVVVLTGDISTDALRAIARQDCVQLNKPVKPKELTDVIQRMLAATKVPTAHPALSIKTSSDMASQVIFVVDDDLNIRSAIRAVLEEEGWSVRDFGTCEAFLDAYSPGQDACLLIDAYLPGMDGLQLLELLRKKAHRLPAIMITGASDVPMVVQAMKAGASDFIEKPVGRDELIASVGRALEQSRDATKLITWRATAVRQMAGLTIRQRQIMELVLAGHPSKNIAADLGISQRTVENHRASIMKKTGSKSLPALARLSFAAASDENNPDAGPSPVPGSLAAAQ